MVKVSMLVRMSAACCFPAAAAAADIGVTYTVDTEAERAAISPYVYGSNASLSGTENFTLRRSGGNRLTGYNWENNYSNAGSDWQHYNDNYLVRNLPGNQQTIPGIVLTRFHDACLAANQLSIVTLPMAGYVSADGNRTVEEAETAPSARWKEVVFAKGTPFCSPPGSPVTGDAYVYMDECVNYLVSRYGDASTAGGVKCYSLDNEPGLWASTHPRIHPNKVGCAELITRSVGLSAAIKDVDPYAQVFGPVLYGFNAYYSLQDAPDWNSVKSGYGWFIDYYLRQMALASASEGRRLLDVLDLHWYPEARGDGKRITESQTTYSPANRTARMQAPRSLWDTAYTEDSWIGQWFRSYLPLLPRLFNSINQQYPGTTLAITEYSYGAADDISGGIAMTDVLGIFGKYGLYAATYWHLGGDYDYVSAAFKIYRNYDGAGGIFGDTKVRATMSDKVSSSIYASMFEGNDLELHLVVLNKNHDQAINGWFNVTSLRTFTSGRVWAFDDASSAITEISPVGAIEENSFSYTIAPLTACHIVLVSECPEGDLDGDCHVGMADLRVLAEQWLDAGGCSGLGCADIDENGVVDGSDLSRLAEDWRR